MSAERCVGGRGPAPVARPSAPMTHHAALMTHHSGRPCLLPKSFERQLGYRPQEFLSHHFKLFHEWPCIFEPAVSRVVFDVGREATRRRGKSRDHPA
jgi:hypothetical protein